MHVLWWRWHHIILAGLPFEFAIQKQSIEDDCSDGEGAQAEQAKPKSHDRNAKYEGPVEQKTTDEQHRSYGGLATN